MILQDFRNVGYCGVGDGDAFEFPGGIAVLTLNFRAVGREINGDVLHFASLHVGEEGRVERFVIFRGLTAGRGHLPQDDRKQNH